MINPLEYPICLTVPHRLTHFSAWHQHIPFAMFLVHLTEPRVIVELGTEHGDSYCAFCQAVSQCGLKSTCYAIDTWSGDPHTGHYSPDVFEDLRLYHDGLYGNFSRLIRSTFEEALRHFEDGTIDLLHIDGYHTYEAARHDFESWKPKMSSRGVILFHDINVRERDFGVWRLWAEIRDRYPHFEFIHGHGLGVLAPGKEPGAKFCEWLDTANAHAVTIREFFFALGHRVELLDKTIDLEVLREAVRKKDEQISAQEIRLNRLQAFSDAARGTFAYQFYKRFIKPFRAE